MRRSCCWRGCLRLVRYGGDSRLFVTAPIERAFADLQREFGRPYFPYLAKVPKPSWDAFLKDKPANGVRLFVLGGSTAAGFPYGNNLMFSRILNDAVAGCVSGQEDRDRQHRHVEHLHATRFPGRDPRAEAGRDSDILRTQRILRCSLGVASRGGLWDKAHRWPD